MLALAARVRFVGVRKGDDSINEGEGRFKGSNEVVGAAAAFSFNTLSDRPSRSRDLDDRRDRKPGAMTVNRKRASA